MYNYKVKLPKYIIIKLLEYIDAFACGRRFYAVVTDSHIDIYELKSDIAVCEYARSSSKLT